MLTDKIKRLLPVCFLFLAGCNTNEPARLQLEQARNLYENAQYGSAKQTLDELKALYPKAFDVQKEAIHLMREIEVREQSRNLFFCDSLLLVRQAEADSMKPYFVFEKTEYDAAGRYVDKSWNPAVGSGADFIKTNVSEGNEIALTAVYKGAAIQYDRLKVSIPSGEYAETQTIPFDGGANYSFQDGAGITYQIVAFQKGRDNGVISFIYNYAREKITMEYAGGKKVVSRIISAKEKQALVKTVDFTAILKDIDQLKKEKDKAGKRMEYLKSKL
ncbi:hypothetical protein FACS189437_05740 [Bacteroidia bacterium]|nr:hypothetical protein FACS189437_05740 [Bacteroidia bacterium]